MSYVRFAAYFLCIFVTPTLYATSLTDLYQQATQEDPIFLTACARYEETRQHFSLALSQMLPDLKAIYGLGTLRSTYTTPQQYETEYTQAQLTQPLFHWDHWIQLGQAQRQEVAAAFEHAHAAQDLLLRVAHIYMDLLKVAQRLHTLEAQSSLYQEQVQASGEHFRAGLIAQTDLLESQARLDQVRAEMLAANLQQTDHLAALRSLIGSEAIELFELPLLQIKDALTPLTQEKSSVWLERSQANAMALAQKQHVAIAKKEIQRLHALHLPTVNATLYYKQGNSAPPLNQKIRTSSAELSVSWPILAGGRLLAETRQAQARYAQTEQQWILAQREAYRSTTLAFQSLEAYSARFSALQTALASQIAAQSAIQAAYEVGTRTVLDVLDAQHKKLNLEQELASTTYDYALAFLELKAAIGALTPADLEAIDQWLTTESSTHS